MDGVAVVEVGEVTGRAEPARPGAPGEVAGDRRQPRLVHAGVDQVEQRPHRPLGQPRVCLPVDAGGGGDGTADQPSREREVDVGAHAVGPPRRHAEPGGEPLCQPPLDAPGRDRDHFCLERVGEAGAEHVPQVGDQRVGAFGAVDDEAWDRQHRGTRRYPC
jgi:hypothetical protein